MTSGNDLQSFNFTITPPTSSNCVIHYSVTATDNDGNMETITVPRSGIGRSSGFDLCTNTYSFTVAAVTIGGNGATSSSMPFFPGSVV